MVAALPNGADKRLMAAAPYTPLLRWSRSLTAEQRALERQHQANAAMANFDWAQALRVPPPRRAGVREDLCPNRPDVAGWWPILPPDVIDCCPWCALPSRSRRRCAGCRTLERAFPAAISTLEFLCCADVATPPESFIHTWKKETGLHDHPILGPCYAETADSIAAPLSAYLEAQAARLLRGRPVVTSVPSRAPLIATTMNAARGYGWFACDVQVSGLKRGSWAQHTAQDKVERQSRTEHDWEVDAAVVRGHDVVLLDDVFVTGTSIFSYAAALKSAGARSIRAIAIVCHVSLRSPHYSDASTIAGRTHDLTWTATRSQVAEITT